MFRYVKAHKFLDYNINPRGTNTGDCQTRAIATAFGITWEEARKRLRDVSKYYSNAIILRKALVDNFGCTKLDIDASEYDSDKGYLTVGEFCDTIGKEGTYLVACGPKDGRANHIVCTINGTLYDTWDSSSQRVFEVFKPNGDYATEGIEISSDIPDNIVKLSFEYERCFNDYTNNNSFADRVRNAIPSLDADTIDAIDKRVSFVASCDISKIHSFNFVLDITGHCYSFGLKLKQKSYNIVFSNDDTYENALANMNVVVSDIYDKYCNLLIKQLKNSIGIKDESSNLRNTRISQTLIKAYQKIDSDVRDKVVNMETFCGYPSAVVNVGTTTNPICYVMVISETAKYLTEGINIVLKYGFNYWDDYHTPRINILPHGFAFNLHKYDSSYRGDKDAFKEFLEDYEDYQWNIEHNEGNDLDYYFESWRVPKFLE